MDDIPEQFDGEGAGNGEFFEVSGADDEDAAWDERFYGCASGLAIDEGELTEGASCLKFGESDAGIGDLACAFDEDEELVSVVAFTDDDFAWVIRAFEGDRHDLEHFLVTEVTEEADLFERGDFAVRLDGGMTEARITDLDADIGNACFPVVYVREVCEELGGALRLNGAIELCKVCRILEISVEPGRTDDDAVSLTEIELKRVDVGADAHAECADDAFAIGVEGDLIVTFALCAEKFVHIVIDCELSAGIAAQEIDAGIANMGDVSRAIGEIDEVTCRCESFVGRIGFGQNIDVTLGLPQCVTQGSHEHFSCIRANIGSQSIDLFAFWHERAHDRLACFSASECP